MLDFGLRFLLREMWKVWKTLKNTCSEVTFFPERGEIHLQLHINLGRPPPAQEAGKKPSGPMWSR